VLVQWGGWVLRFGKERLLLRMEELNIGDERRKDKEKKMYKLFDVMVSYWCVLS